MDLRALKHLLMMHFRVGKGRKQRYVGPEKGPKHNSS